MNPPTAEPRDSSGSIGPASPSRSASPPDRTGAAGPSRRRRSFVLFVLYCIATSVVLLLFVVRPGIDGHPRAMFPDLVHGRADKPFAFRILVPTLVRGISAATPDALEAAVEEEFARKRLVRALAWKTESIYEYLAAMALAAVCFIGTLYTWRRLVSRFFRFPDHVADLAPAIGLLAVTLFFRYYSYVYDPATLLLSSLAIVALESGNTRLFYVNFTLAALNKETSLLLIPVFFAGDRAKLTVRRLLAHGSGLAFVWFAIRFFVVYLFRDNPGGLVEYHLFDHNLRLPWVQPVATVYFAAVLVAAAWLAGNGWKTKPLFLRRGLLITFLPLLAASLVFGFVDELRGYYEAYPFLFLLSIPTLCAVFGIRGEAGAEP